MKTSVFVVTILLCLGLSCHVEGIGIPLKFRKRQQMNGDLTTFGKDLLWTASVKMGSPPQPLDLLVDTGSSDTLAYSDLCTNEDCWRNFRGRKPFKKSESDTFVPLGGPDPLGIIYGNGISLAYHVGKDVVDVSGTPITDQPVGAVSNIINQAMQADGVLGLGPENFIADGGREIGVKTVYRSLAEQKKIPSARFSIRLDSDVDGKGGGMLRFGDPDKSDVSGDIVYTPTTSNDYWQVASNDITVGTTSLGRKPDVVFDTGASLIFGPCGVVSSIYNEIPDSNLTVNGNWTIPCDTTTSVTFNINDHPWVVPSSDVVLKDEKSPYNPSHCVGAIQQYDDENFVILGVPFIKNYLLVFDADTKQVGLGKRAT